VLFFRTAFAEDVVPFSIPVIFYRSVDGNLIVARVEVKKYTILLGQLKIVQIPQPVKLTYPNAKWTYQVTVYEIPDLDVTVRMDALPMLRKATGLATVRANELLIKTDDPKHIGETFTAFVQATLGDTSETTAFELARFEVEGLPEELIIADQFA
jgi:hypothetical protein